jgi:hypothetical protein
LRAISSIWLGIEIRECRMFVGIYRTLARKEQPEDKHRSSSLLMTTIFYKPTTFEVLLECQSKVRVALQIDGVEVLLVNRLCS